jgi:hypothetical protein
MYKDGDKVRVKANTSEHGFKIGEEVRILQVTCDDIIAMNSMDIYYYLGEDEIEPIENIKKLK